MDIEEREIKVKVTKRRITEEEADKIRAEHGHGSKAEQRDGDSCGPWYFKIAGGVYYTCRICYAGGGPTGFPYEECVALPS